MPLLISLLANFILAGTLIYLGVNKPLQVNGSGKKSSETSSAAAPATEKIEALGRVQPKSRVVSVYGPPGDRITELKVKLGDIVEKGKLLTDLSGDDERQLSIETLKAQLAEADFLRKSIVQSKEAKLKDLDQEAKQAIEKAESDIGALSAQINGLEAQRKSAEEERERMKRIELEGVRVSEQEKAQANLQVIQAVEGLNAARAQRDAAQSLLKNSSPSTQTKRKAIEAETERGLAQVPYQSILAGLKAAEQKLESARVRAPIDGKVVRLFAVNGETLATQPVLQLADTRNMVVIAEVYESSVARLREWVDRSPTKSINVEIDARVIGTNEKVPASLKGTVTADQITPMIAKNMIFALGPREDTDRRVVEVEVQLDQQSSSAVAGFIGLQVRARFLPK